jgi:hypothetical protein
MKNNKLRISLYFFGLGLLIYEAIYQIMSAPKWSLAAAHMILGAMIGAGILAGSFKWLIESGRLKRESKPERIEPSNHTATSH